MENPPLTPADCDLRDSKFMPLYVQALFNSGFNVMRDDTAWRAGVTLWLKAWHQVPAASLPDDDEDLCALAGFGRDLKRWKKVRDKALRGWIRCNDGRLYHPLIAEAALEAWISRLLGRITSAAGHARRWGAVSDPADLEARIAEALPLLKALNPQAEAVRKVERRKMPVACQGKGEGEGEAKDQDSPLGEGTGFETFRDAYPAGHGAATAGRAWAAVLGEGHDPAVILAGLAAAKAKWRKEQTPPRFVPLAINWLERRAWLNFAPERPPKPWRGPQAVRDAVLSELGPVEGEAFARSYLDPAGWTAPDAIVARTGVAADKLRALSALCPYRITTRK
jgi:hypothetical protein